MAKGLQIVLEGLDSSGKTTQANILTRWLKEEKGIDTIYTRHPGATLLGKELRRLMVESHEPIDAHTRALLFAADNSAYIHEILKPKLASGVWVVADRNNFVSSMAYQIADGCDFAALDGIHTATAANSILNTTPTLEARMEVPPVDLLMILRPTFETVQQRLQKRSLFEQNDAYQKKLSDRKYFDKIMNAYDRLIEEQTTRLLKFVKPTTSDVAPGIPRCQFINANGTIEEVSEQIRESVQVLIDEQTKPANPLCIMYYKGGCNTKLHNAADNASPDFAGYVQVCDKHLSLQIPFWDSKNCVCNRCLKTC